MSLVIIEENWKAIDDAEKSIRDQKGDPEAGFNPTMFFMDGVRKLMIPLKYRSKKGKKGAETFTKSHKEVMVIAKYCPFTGKPLYEPNE